MAEQIKKNNSLAITKENQLSVVGNWNNQLSKLTETQGVKLSNVEKDFAVSILTNLSNRCIKGNIKTNELNMTDFLEQVKHNSRLQLSVNEKELWLDIRNDKNTGLKTVTISRQYQGTQKLLRKYCSKKVVRFCEGVVCKGDGFETRTDFSSGLCIIEKHIENKNIDRNNFSNIEKAYSIVYCEEFGQLVPYVCIVDKKRLERARDAASTKAVWNSDTKAMVLKTAYWCLYAMMKPYIDIPIEYQESFAETEDEMDFNKEHNSIDKTIEYDIPMEEIFDTQDDFIVGEVVEDTKDNEEKEATEDSEEPQEEILTIKYGEYKNNQDKYEQIRGTYDKSTSTIQVKLKK